jgi:hypothetical protein
MEYRCKGSRFALTQAPEAAVSADIAGQMAVPSSKVAYYRSTTDSLRAGSNDIRIDVYNTAINQLAEGGRLPDVDAVAERYGQRFRLQDLDTLQPIPSGILTVPRLVAER